MEINIYNSALNRLGIVENQTALLWTRKYYEPGSFELYLPLTPANIELISIDNIVSKKGSKEVGIIESVEYVETASQNQIVARGRFMSSYTDRRLIKDKFNFSGKAEIAMRELLTLVEDIPLLEFGELNDLDGEISFQVNMKNLLETLIKISKGNNIGFSFIPDFVNKKIIFKTYRGVDHSKSQSLKNKVIFSEQYENILKTNYLLNKQLEKSVVYVLGEGEAENRALVIIGEASGLNLKELSVDASDISSEGLSREEYLNLLNQRGLEALEESKVYESLECEATDNNFKYKKDYDLGDIVTIVKKKWGYEVNKRITEIQEIYENNGLKIVPVFGNPLPLKIDWRE